jgi:hypothetical protein
MPSCWTCGGQARRTSTPGQRDWSTQQLDATTHEWSAPAPWAVASAVDAHAGPAAGARGSRSCRRGLACSRCCSRSGRSRSPGAASQGQRIVAGGERGAACNAPMAAGRSLAAAHHRWQPWCAPYVMHRYAAGALCDVSASSCHRSGLLLPTVMHPWQLATAGAVAGRDAAGAATLPTRRPLARPQKAADALLHARLALLCGGSRRAATLRLFATLRGGEGGGGRGTQQRGGSRTGPVGGLSGAGAGAGAV